MRPIVLAEIPPITAADPPGAAAHTIETEKSAPSYRPVTNWSDGVRRLRRRRAVRAEQARPYATDALLNRLVEARRRAVPASAELALAAR